MFCRINKKHTFAPALGHEAMFFKKLTGITKQDKVYFLKINFAE